MKTRQTHFAQTPAVYVEVAVLALMTLFAVPGGSAGAERGRDDRLVFENVRAQAEQFIDYFSSIRLTKAQERIKA